jgi:hypothetical protein
MLDQYAARRAIDYPVGRAADEPPPGTGVAASADDDEVEATGAGELEDPLACVSGDGLAVQDNPVLLRQFPGFG